MMKRRTQEDYIDDLNGTDLQTRLKALEKIGRLKIISTTAIFRVISLLNDQHWKIRAGAAHALGNMGPQAEASIRYLIYRLDDEKISVKANAIVALGRMGRNASPAIPKLIQALRDSSYTIRVTACGALGSIGPSAVRAASDLMKIVSKADNFTEKYCAWQAIKAIFPDNLTEETLSRYVETEEIPKNNPFAGELKSRVTQKRPPTQKTIERYISNLDDADPKKRAAAMRKLSDVVCLKQADLDLLIVPSIPTLISLLSDNSWKVRSWAARLLGRIGPRAENAIPNLTVALQDQISTVRECAAYALGLMGEKANASIPMLELALHDPNQYVRNHAHMSLTRLDHMRKLSEKIDDDDVLDWYHVDDDEIDVHYAVVGYKEHIPAVRSYESGDDIKEEDSKDSEVNLELLKTLKGLRADPTLVSNLYHELFNARLWVLVQQPVRAIEDMLFLTYPTKDGVRELPAFTAPDRELLVQLVSRTKDADVQRIEGKRLWSRLLGIVKTGVCEVAVDPGEVHGICLTREMILGMLNKYGSDAEG